MKHILEKVYAHTWAAFTIAAKQMISRPWLSLATLLGLVISISLTLSIPVYADAVYYTVFKEDLKKVDKLFSSQIDNSNITLKWMYSGQNGGLKTWDEAATVDNFFSGVNGDIIDLPLKQATRYYVTDTLELFPLGETNFSNSKNRLSWTTFANLSGFKNHIQIIEGQDLSTQNLQPDGIVEVLISKSFAELSGVQVGETYTVFKRFEVNDLTKTVQIPVRVVGVWQATDAADPYWFIELAYLEKHLIISEEAFIQQIGAALPKPIYSAFYYQIFDGSTIQYEDAPSLVNQILRARQQADQLLPGLLLFSSPLDALNTYLEKANLLTIRLFLFSIPVLGLVFAFISLASSLAVEQRRNEIAVLRSRGSGTLQVVGITFSEGIMLSGLALAISIPCSLVLASLIGQARSFLDFSAPALTHVRLNSASLQFGLGALVLSILSQVLPAISAAQHTIVSYKQERSRMMRKPWWQRAFLDVLLLIPSVYGAYLIQKQGSIIVSASSNPFDNPLLFLVPALCIFTATLFFIRLIPYLVNMVAWISAHTGAVGILMAARHLARSPSFYITPLVLVTLTLSLSVYTASLAETLDQHLYDQVNYLVGASLKFTDYGEVSGGNSMVPGLDQGSNTEASWAFLPVGEYQKISWVRNVARVGSFTTTITISGRDIAGKFIGIDRYEFPGVSFWRSDFASTDLVDLMNELAYQPDGILIPNDMLGQPGLSTGDTLRLMIQVYGQKQEVSYKIAGGFTYFPTWYPEDGPAVVGDLDTLFEKLGGEFPYQVWVQTAPGTDYHNLNDEGTGLLKFYGAIGTGWDAAPLRIEKEQTQPDRQGLFGVLSTGFIAAALLSVLGFLLYAIFSFRRRFVEFGVLRAIGLSNPQMISYLFWELIFLIGAGIGAGTGIGVAVARWFIPYLQVGYGPSDRIPPYIVAISWLSIFRTYILFGVLFLAALVVLITLLRRLKIFQAIKLGETV